MKRITTLITWIVAACLFCQDVNAQTTYYTGFDTDAEKANWTEFQKGKTDASKWEIVANGVSAPSKLIHSAPTGDANKDSLVNWYVSPKFDFSEGGALDSIKYNYYSFMNTFFEEQVVQIYLLVGDKDPAKASSKVLLADLGAFYSGDADNWRDTGGFVIPNTVGDCYIAFKFVAIDGWSSISFDNIFITETKLVGIEKIVKNNPKLFLYPNPSNGVLHLKDDLGILAGNGATIAIYNLQGTKIMEESISMAKEFNWDIPRGTYVYKIADQNGTVQSIHKLIINHE